MTKKKEKHVAICVYRSGTSNKEKSSAVINGGGCMT